MSDIPSEKTQAKAAEYLLKGRVKVTYLVREDVAGHMGPACEANVFSATQSGDPYRVRFAPKTGWHCDCPARVPVCAHVLACMTITDLVAAPSREVDPHVFGGDTDIDNLLEGL